MKWLLLILLFACTPLSPDADTHGHEQITKTFGPGIGPQTHKISLRQFERVQDIAPAHDLPEPITRKTPTRHRISLTAKEVVSDIAPNITYLYWTFNETVPGPFLRVREGDTVELTLYNHHTSGHNHSIDLHAVNGPGGGAGATEVAPGETKTFTFKALNPGLYVYHCATPNVPTHMANGMYGLILVEPIEGYPPVDAEFALMQGELYTSGTIGETGIQHFDGNKILLEQPEYIVFNGRTRALADTPFLVKTNQTVRLFVGNGGVAKNSNFHVIGEIFDTVYAEGGTNTIHNVQTTNIPAGGATIVEFTVDVPGRYVLVDHALARLDRGTFGIIEARGPPNPLVFDGERTANGH
ncbi:nitrite reductase, copper-containing [Candidatus Woesearchaeota archaeon]|nr:MAG: nitrite reductase, copper-containing [Candidatus Woesearchaeota archaeon]